MTHRPSGWLIGSIAAVAACTIHLGKTSDKATSTETGTSAECPSLGDPFKVQVTVLTEHEDAPTDSSMHLLIDDAGLPIAIEGDTGLVGTVTGEALLRREIEVHLTNNFITAEGERVCRGDNCISFEVSDIRFRADIEDTSCTDLLELGTADDPRILDGTISLSQAIEDAVDACEDPAVRPSQSLNLYIYDSCTSNAAGVVDCDEMTDSRGRNNMSDGVYSPYVFLDYARLQHQGQAPEEHEFGHAFGLNHTCHPDVENENWPSNIMQSKCDGAAPSGGKRELGFDSVAFYESKDTCDTGIECHQPCDPEIQCLTKDSVNQVDIIMDSAEAFVASWCTASP